MWRCASSGPWHCSLTDANDVNKRAVPTAGGRGNLRGAPGFACSNISLGAYHLAFDSPCKDAGDTLLVGPDERDIDGEERVLDADVDMGADEAWPWDVDFNNDGIVDYLDFEFFSRSWFAQPPDPDYDELTDLDEDNNVDLADLLDFAPQWLWEACRPHDPTAVPLGNGGELMMMGVGPGGSFASAESVSAVPAASDEGEATGARSTQLGYLAEWLENLWLEDAEVRESIKATDWAAFMEQVYQAISQEASLYEGLAEEVK